MSIQPLGLPVSTEQNLQALVQTEPNNIKVAVPADQHSEIFGQCASSHTVFNLLPCTSFLIFAKLGSMPAFTLIHDGFLVLGIEA